VVADQVDVRARLDPLDVPFVGAPGLEHRQAVPVGSALEVFDHGVDPGRVLGMSAGLVLLMSGQKDDPGRTL
jgi:hypothetical protein